MENISSSFVLANGQKGEKRKLPHTPTSLSEPKRTKRKIIKTLTDKNTKDIPHALLSAATTKRRSSELFRKKNKRVLIVEAHTHSHYITLSAVTS